MIALAESFIGLFQKAGEEFVGTASAATASSKPDEVAFVVSSLGLSKEVLDCVRALRENEFYVT